MVWAASDGLNAPAKPVSNHDPGQYQDHAWKAAMFTPTNPDGLMFFLHENTFFLSQKGCPSFLGNRGSFPYVLVSGVHDKQVIGKPLKVIRSKPTP